MFTPGRQLLSAPGDDLSRRINDNAAIVTAACNLLQRCLECGNLAGIEGPPGILVIPPCAQVCQVQLGHVSRRLFQKSPLALHQTPTRSGESVFQNGAHLECLTMVPLQLFEKPIVEPQRRVTGLQRFRLVNHEPSPGCRYARPRGQDFLQGTKMRQQEPAEQDIRSVDRKRNADDVMHVELKAGALPCSRLLYEHWGSIQPDGSVRFQRIVKQAGGPAGAAAEIHRQPWLVYTTAPQQFPRFRFVQFGQPAQSRTGAQVISERVFVGGCFLRWPFSHSAIVAQTMGVER